MSYGIGWGPRTTAQFRAYGARRIAEAFAWSRGARAQLDEVNR